jgi:hypothetical protein
VDAIIVGAGLLAKAVSLTTNNFSQAQRLFNPRANRSPPN